MAKLIVANWKLHPLSEQEAVRLARGSDHKNAVICPPFPFLGAVRKALKHAALGAQDTFWEPEGPYTGEVSAAMLKRLGTAYVIIGHSERRQYLHETDEMIREKAFSAIAAGLRVVLCVGEPKAVRRRGLASAKQYVGNQLRKDLTGVRGSIIVAYEPIWAIGTGVPDKPEESAAMAKFIKQVAGGRLQVAGVVRVLYGGSVKPKNARAFLSQKEIDGALVGGASLDAKTFRAIVRAGQ